MKLSKVVKNIKILIWHMVDEMVKKNGVGQSFIFHAIIPAHYTFKWKFY